jgi:hypothetical protein
VSSASQYVPARCATSVGVLWYICVLVLLYMCPHTCCSSVAALLQLCPRTAVYVSSCCYMCVLILLHICVLILQDMCPHTGVSLSSCCCIFVRMLLYLCRHTAVHVSACCYMCPHAATCVLIVLYMRPHTTIHIHTGYGAPFTMSVLIMLYVSSYYIHCKYAAAARIEQDPTTYTYSIYSMRTHIGILTVYIV